MTLRMSLREYFKPQDGLPDPQGPLCNSLASNAIAMANKEVEKEIAKKKKRGQCETKSNGRVPYVSIYMVLSNTADSRKLFHFLTL